MDSIDVLDPSYGNPTDGTGSLVSNQIKFNDYQNINRGSLLKVRGKVERRLDEIQIIADKIKFLEGEENEE